MGIIAIANILALLSSPFFLGPDYSKQVLIDNYCANNSNGSSLIFEARLDHKNCTKEDVASYKNSFDSEFNTIFNISLKNASINNEKCNLVGSRQSTANNYFNKYRVYSDYGWDYLKNENCVCIPDVMVSQLGLDFKSVINTDIEILINGILYNFKIGGYYNTTVIDSGWRSRGSYFHNTFDNCIFVNETFLMDKFDTVFEMITSDTEETGMVFDSFNNFVIQHNSSIVYGKNLRENELLNKLNVLNKTQRNKTIQTVVVASSVVLLSIILCISIYLFDVDNFRLPKRKIALFIWCLLYYAVACVFVLIVKGKLLNLLGFTAFGANKALLNIILIFLALFVIAVSLKTFIRYVKDKAILDKNRSNENSKGDIIFVTKAKFPDDNAFATYIGAIASTYKKAGYRVTCIGSGYSESGEILESYFGNFVSLRRGGNSIISKILNHLLFESRVCTYIQENFEKPIHIFFSCEYSLSFYDKIKNYFSDSNTGYSYIITEEYTEDEFEKYTFLSKKSLKINHYFLDKYIDESDSFIVISKYLLEKVEKKKMKCIYIPFSFNADYVSSFRKEPKEHDGINYIYCGSPENKDLLPAMIEAFSNLGKIGHKYKVHFDIIGVDENWAANHGVASFDKDIVSFYGRQNKEFIYDKYAISDYSVLLRDENKVFAKAGFPTKISESMAFGVVPICNISSNLGDYLNNTNSIIVDGHTSKDLVSAIRISVVDIKKNTARKNNAISTANKFFNIDEYTNDLFSIIKK